MTEEHSTTASAETILVIEDDPLMLNGLEQALQLSGYRTLAASDATRALELTRAELPDLIVSDFQLGARSGVDILDQVRSNEVTRVIPFIIITGDDNPQCYRDSLIHGADGFLKKPFEVKDLIAAVRTRLEHARRLRETSDKSRRQLLELLNLLPDLAAIVDPVTLAFWYLNPAGRQMLGGVKESVLSEIHLSDRMTPRSREVFLGEAVPSVAGGRAWRGELTLLAGCNEEISVQFTLLGHLTEERQLECLSVVAHDISARKSAEKERDQIEVHLRQAQKLEAIGQLAAGIAHEINSPTQYIGDNTRFLKDSFDEFRGLLELFRELRAKVSADVVEADFLDKLDGAMKHADLDYLLEEIPNAIDQSLDGVGRVSKIVRAMKEFSHPGTTEKTPVDINGLIESTITVARNEWKYVAEMKTNFATDLPPVPCLPGEFNQVILNLIVNASHAIGDLNGPDGSKLGTISISTRRDGDQVEVLVADTGGGIPESARSRIFEPFFTTKEVGRGTGQGLAISRSVVVDKHQGTLEFETEAGRGTTFIIRLPIDAGTGFKSKEAA